MLIGNIEISPAVFPGPMAGISNHAFRVICRRFGAGAVWTEMISSYGIRFRNPTTLSMFDWTPEEGPVIVQLFGADPATMASSAQIIEEAGADIIDLNMGCPVPKVTKTKAGAALMGDLKTAEAIVSSVVKAVTIPVTLKTRKGINEGNTTALELARVAEGAGASAVTIHGRTAAQGYSGQADWTIIEQATNAVGIPVIGNGDVVSPADARRMLDQTGCAGIMIGRGALGNPFIFKRTAEFLETGQLMPEPTYAERTEIARQHLALMIELKGEERAVREMRGQIAWYVKHTPGAARLRKVLSQAQTASDVESALLCITD